MHTHSYASAEHTHAARTGETATAPATPPVAAQTCARFIELDSPWTYSNSHARGPIDGSVWVAVDAIEYLMEKTVPANSVSGSDEDVEGVEIRLKASHASRVNTARIIADPRSFILEGAVLADVAQSVRCQPAAAPVAVTAEALTE